MLIYEGPYLSITYEREFERFVQCWLTSPPDIVSFKSEMLIYTDQHIQIKPSQTLWLQQNFSLTLEVSDMAWIEEYVNIPCINAGSKMAAFVVGEDILAHILVMESFEKMDSATKPMHFATEKEARLWLDGLWNNIKSNGKPSISFNGLDKEGNFMIRINSHPGDIYRTLKWFKGLLEDRQFTETHQAKYDSLTKREKEIMSLVSRGMISQDIANELYLSVHTVRTHIRNIKSKLEITTQAEIVHYVASYDIGWKNTQN